MDKKELTPFEQTVGRFLRGACLSLQEDIMTGKYATWAELLPKYELTVQDYEAALDKYSELQPSHDLAVSFSKLNGVAYFRSLVPPESIKTRMITALSLYSGGMTLKDSCDEAGIKNQFYRYMRKFPEYFTPLLDNAKILRKAHKLEEMTFAKEELADVAYSALQKKLHTRKVQSIVKKSGTSIAGGTPVAVDTVTRKVEEKEPELAAIKLALELSGEYKKQVEVDMRIEGEVVSYKKPEIDEIQAKDLERLEKLKLTEGDSDGPVSDVEFEQV